MASTINAKNTSTGLVISPDSSGQLELQTVDTTRMTIDSSGNVGIGTSSPSANLEIFGASTPYQIIGNGTQRSFLGVDGGGGFTGTLSNHSFFLRTNNTNRLTIDTSGNVLVGVTSTPSGSVGGAGFIREASNRSTLYCASTTSASTSLVYFFNSNGLVGRIDTSASATSYVTSSDYRLKDNITPMVGALEKVAQLNPVNWTWKVDGSDGQGFIAHELQAVVPDCVSGTKDAVDADGNPIYQGVDTSFLVATLTAAIKELKAELDTVKAELATLKGTA